MTPREKLGATVAALVLAAVAAIHFALAPGELDETTYVGVLFVLAGVGATLAAVLLWRSNSRAAWMLGAAVCFCTFVSFVLSRTTGLPGGYSEESWDALGLLSLGLEGGFLVLYAVAETTSALARPRRATALGR